MALNNMLFSKKNILVTGGAGFIGSHLCEKLVNEHNVICVDNFISSTQDNISHLFTNAHFEFIRHDVSKPFELERFPELERFNIPTLGVQEIYHLSCPTSPKDFDKYKIQTLEANSIGMKHMLDVAVRYRAKFLQASSAVVYGSRSDDNVYFKEDEQGYVNTLSPRACYDEGKRFAETMVATYRQVYDIDAKIARIFRTFGPRMRLFDGQMIPDFIVNALDNRDLVIYGDKSFRTSLTYVDDIVDGLIKLMNSAEASLINFGSGEDYKLVSVAEKIIEMIASKSKIVFEEPLQFMTNLGLPDISLAKELLDWIPVTRLEDGLEKTIEYTKANKALISEQYLKTDGSVGDNI